MNKKITENNTQHLHNKEGDETVVTSPSNICV